MITNYEGTKTRSRAKGDQEEDHECGPLPPHILFTRFTFVIPLPTSCLRAFVVRYHRRSSAFIGGFLLLLLSAPARADHLAMALVVQASQGETRAVTDRSPPPEGT